MTDRGKVMDLFEPSGSKSSRSAKQELESDRIKGALLGLALGDAGGAPYEGGIPERALWALIGRSNGKRRWTDDTRMTIDVVESLIACGDIDQNDLAERFSKSYRWSRGYGPGAAKVLKRIRRGQSWEMAGRSVYPEGSFGNGGAMRAPAVGLFFAADSEDKIAEAARACAAITHAHPLGCEGAVLVALATALTFNDCSPDKIIERLSKRAKAPEFLSRLATADRRLQSESSVAPKTVAQELGNRVAAVESCVTAIYAALAFRKASFNELIDFVIKIGGDVDTIAAMAGAIWGAGRGIKAIPVELLEQLERREELEDLAASLGESMARRAARDINLGNEHL